MLATGEIELTAAGITAVVLCPDARQAATTRQKRRRVVAAQRQLAPRELWPGRRSPPALIPELPRGYNCGEVGCHPLVQSMGVKQM